MNHDMEEKGIVGRECLPLEPRFRGTTASALQEAVVPNALFPHTYVFPCEDLEAVAPEMEGFGTVTVHSDPGRNSAEIIAETFPNLLGEREITAAIVSTMTDLSRDVQLSYCTGLSPPGP
ncbi:unnamed protein product [Boreogadus saida]